MARTLLEKMEFWRSERPDEWIMDELIRDVQDFQKQLAEANEVIKNYANKRVYPLDEDGRMEAQEYLNKYNL
jgi:hypothetical protein